MRRSRRRRVLRDEAVAPVLVMAVILGLWWIGARVVSALWSPGSGAGAARIQAPARASPPDRGPVGAGGSVPPHPTAPASAKGRTRGLTDEDVEVLRSHRLLVPVDGIDPDTLTSTFHQRRGNRTHEALDLMAPRGTRVRAVEGGRIARLLTSQRGGLAIYQFDSSESYCYYYAHLDGYASSLAEGAMVTGGEVVGFVGSTGNASPDAPHLHFAIFKLGPERRWWQGLPIDPYLVLR
jgi:peptidoglycan LD-endopeptidase LytH